MHTLASGISNQRLILAKIGSPTVDISCNKTPKNFFFLSVIKIIYLTILVLFYICILKFAQVPNTAHANPRNPVEGMRGSGESESISTDAPARIVLFYIGNLP